ncbi:hypothetical protein EMCLV009L [Equine molluscum contagiosum-like virus]|nr:hypothetical protein EMCLV009L [Equine molluscum contagiosum-like virus]
MRPPALVRDSVIAGELCAQLQAADAPRAAGEFGRRLLGLVQYCGLCSGAYHVNALRSHLRFTGSTRAVRLSPSCVCADDGLYAVLCLSNRGQALALFDSRMHTRHDVAMAPGDLLVVPLSFRVYFGRTHAAQQDVAAAYFVALFCPCPAPEPAPVALALDAVPEELCPFADEERACAKVKAERA